MKSTLCSSFLIFTLFVLLTSPTRLFIDRGLGSIVQIVICLILSIVVARMNPFGLFLWLEKFSIVLRLIIGFIVFIVGGSVSILLAART